MRYTIRLIPDETTTRDVEIGDDTRLRDWLQNRLHLDPATHAVYASAQPTDPIDLGTVGRLLPSSLLYVCPRDYRPVYVTVYLRDSPLPVVDKFFFFAHLDEPASQWFDGRYTFASPGAYRVYTTGGTMAIPSFFTLRASSPRYGVFVMLPRTMAARCRRRYLRELGQDPAGNPDGSIRLPPHPTREQIRRSDVKLITHLGFRPRRQE